MYTLRNDEKIKIFISISIDGIPTVKPSDLSNLESYSGMLTSFELGMREFKFKQPFEIDLLNIKHIRMLKAIITRLNCNEFNIWFKKGENIYGGENGIYVITTNSPGKMTLKWKKKALKDIFQIQTTKINFPPTSLF